MLLEALEWLGHSGFRIRCGRANIYIDPYRVKAGPKADVILITHDHYDHFSRQDVERLASHRTRLVGPASVCERLSGRVVSVEPGETVWPELAPGVEVHAVAAYNTSKRDTSGDVFHPPEARWLGFELNLRGRRLYHSGDTDVIPEMDRVTGVEIALLPVSGTYVMTPSEAAEAARRIQPRLAVPMHWGTHIGSQADAEAFAETAPVDVRILDKAA